MKWITTAWILLLSTNILAVQIRVETDRQNYYSGQELNVYVMAVNTQAVNVVLGFPSYPQVIIGVDGQYQGYVEFPAVSSVTIPAYGTKIWSTQLNWDYWPLSPGSHFINGKVRGYGEATSAPFLVEQAVLPEDKVLIDFYSIPGTDLPATSLFAYEAAGIHFSTKTTEPRDLTFDRTAQRLKANSTTYPPGFNIIATLDFPVYGASVDAYTATGVQITMIAKDSDGQVIASATTEPAIYEIAQPVKLHASRRIETLEWWPSNYRAGVGIGNLCLYRLPSVFMEHDQQMVTLHWAPDVVHSGLEVCTNLQDAVWSSLSSSIGTNAISVPITNSPACYYRLKFEEGF